MLHVTKPPRVLLSAAYIIPGHSALVSHLKYQVGVPRFAVLAALSVLPRARQVLSTCFAAAESFCRLVGYRIRFVVYVACVRMSVQPVHGKFLVSTSYDNTVKMWNARNYSHIKTLGGHENKIMCCDITQVGNTARVVFALSLFPPCRRGITVRPRVRCTGLEVLCHCLL